MRNITLEKQLSDAIKKHEVVRLQYKRQNYYRTIEPYIIYRSTQDNILLGGTQTVDDSQPLKPPEPHNFEIELISTLKITGKAFDYDEKFNPSAKEYRNGIFCVIQRQKASK